MSHYYHPYQQPSVSLPPLSSLTGGHRLVNQPLGHTGPAPAAPYLHYGASPVHHQPSQQIMVPHNLQGPTTHMNMTPAGASSSATSLTLDTSNDTSPTATMPRSSERRKTPSSWDPHDDMILRHLKEQLKLGWKEISSHFPNRTTNACQFRWRRLMSGTLRNKPSTAEGTGSASVEQTSPISMPTSADSTHPTSPASSPTGAMTTSTVPVQVSQSPQGAHTPSQAANIGSLVNPIPVNGNSASYSPGTERIFVPNVDNLLVTPAPESSPSQHQNQQQSASSSPFINGQKSQWTPEEDNLVMTRPDIRELTLLIPHKSEQEIAERMNVLRRPSSHSMGLETTSPRPTLLLSSSSSPLPTMLNSLPSPSSPHQLQFPSSQTSSYSPQSVPPTRPRLSKPSYFEGMRLPAPIVRNGVQPTTTATSSPIQANSASRLGGSN